MTRETEHAIRIARFRSKLWKLPEGKPAPAWQWVFICKAVGPERTTEASAARGGKRHVRAQEQLGAVRGLRK